MSERTYSERDVADLIARAVERQQEARRRTPEVGLTLDEVERIGRETGIDPAHLRAAAAEMDAAGRTLTRQTTTSDKHVGVERWIDAPLSPEGWEDAVAHLRDHFGLSMASGMSSGGTVQQVGNAYEWQHTSTLGVQTTVTASPRDGRTRLRMRQLVGMASSAVEGAAYGFLPALLAGLGGGAAGGALGGGSAVVLLSAVLAFVLAWAVAIPTIAHLDRRWRAKKLRALDALADDVGDALSVAPTTPSGPPVADGQAVSPALDARLLDDDAPPTDGVAATRRVRE